MEASCWVARKIFLSAARASSSARTLDSRPTTKGVIMKGKMTTSRMGIMGSFLDSNFSLDVVTESPWDNGQPARTLQFYRARGIRRHGTYRPCLTDYSCGILKLYATGAAGRDVASYVSTKAYPAFSIT